MIVSRQNWTLCWRNAVDKGNFMYFFNRELREEERIFKLAGAELVGEDKIRLEFLIAAKDYDSLLTDALKQKVAGIVAALLPQGMDSAIRYRKTISEEDYILQCLHEFLYRESPLLYPKLKDAEILIAFEYNTVKITIPHLPSDVYGFMVQNGFGEKIENALDCNVMESVEVELGRREGSSVSSTAVRRRKKTKEIESIKTVDVTVSENVVGAVARKPLYIKTALGGEKDTQTVCGTVKDLTKKTSKLKQKDFYLFRIDDTTGSIAAKYFPRDAEKSALFEQKIQNGCQIVAEGPVRMDQYSHELSLTVYRLALCQIDFATIDTEVKYLSAEDDYVTVRPEAYCDEEQTLMFQEDGPLPELLRGDVVVFDLETTGIKSTSDRIIEIGAVKLRDGVMIETFSTLINPEMPIPAEASGVNHIYDKDVEHAPVLGDVIGDFYKFTRGALMVAHNASFDMGFITYYGKEHRYLFDNPVADTLQMARERLRRSKYNLESLCKDFKIEIGNAHRATYDAVATAKVLKQLCRLGK